MPPEPDPVTPTVAAVAAPTEGGSDYAQIVAGIIAKLVSAGVTDRDTIATLHATRVLDRALIAQLQAEGTSYRAKIANLETALVSARRIGGAIGILMNREHLTEEQAFTVLREASQNSNRKLRDIADAVLTTGGLPVTAPAGKCERKLLQDNPAPHT